jgi:hypothetical protein
MLQSMFFAFDWNILPTLMSHTICSDNKNTTILESEFKFARAVLNANYGIRPQQLATRGIAFRPKRLLVYYAMNNTIYIHII